EPATVSTNGYMLGMHAPGEALMLKALPSVHHQLLGHGLSLQALRAANVPGDIGITNVYSPMVPASINPLDKLSAGLMDMAQNRLYADPVLLGKYPDTVRAATFFSSFSPSSEDMALISQPLDFYGLNYYMPTRVASGPGEGAVPKGMAEAMGDDLSGTAPGAPFHIASFPDTETTAYGWPIKPEYMGVALAEMAERYPDLPPVYVTEGGASFEDLEIRDREGRLIIPDERRARYLSDHIAAAIEATSPGGPAESVDLRGYYVWSLMDNFEWSGGYKQQFGLLHVDRETQNRTKKASYYWLQEVLAARHRDAAPKAPATPASGDVAAGDVAAGAAAQASDVERPHPVG
ncbi:glycoside hydrolase family 1 protein, partial [Arthrobacter sp. SO3]|uniref:glycoside hydrolase family 1 protein n=1 Tax=Arthrobacter sp. SO3 TaxID=1897057 RepID=UPI001CFFCA93